MQPFRIRKMTKPPDANRIEIEAHHVSYQLSENIDQTGLRELRLGPGRNAMGIWQNKPRKQSRAALAFGVRV
jgi:hypothetical protein